MLIKNTIKSIKPYFNYPVNCIYSKPQSQIHTNTTKTTNTNINSINNDENGWLDKKTLAEYVKK